MSYFGNPPYLYGGPPTNRPAERFYPNESYSGMLLLFHYYLGVLECVMTLVQERRVSSLT